jgi:cytochrome c peroxidase
VRTLVLVAVLGCRSSEKHPAPPPAAKPASSRAFYADTFARRPSVPELTQIGALVFADPSLSASGTVACATCHDPHSAFGPPNDKPVQLGGVRAAPSLRYLNIVQRFDEHHVDGDDGSRDAGPAGGFTWDGRMQTTHDQARSPLFSPLEMANRSPAELTEKLKHAAYADRLRATFGATILDTPEAALKAITLALEVYQQDPAIFYPYTSRFDDVLRGTAKLSPEEERGRRLFEDPAKGNCASCHPDTISSGLPAFTDFGYNALGAPRNPEIPANHDPSYVDLGLCGPYRTDLSTHAGYCGRFRTPSLRNVATRHRFFHNGVFTSLQQVVEFYATRDTNPHRWYGQGEPFNDLPAKYRGNVEHGAPFDAHLTPSQVHALIAFLSTLTDRT